jgi:protocatechuate 3,4-dioxygenase beta subunit
MRRTCSAAAIFIVLLMLAGAGTASAAPTGTISGTVTDGAANPLGGACVTATAPGGGFGSASTDASGNYAITGLAPETYTVVFSGCSAGNYAPNTITGVQVTAGQTTTQNTSLPTGATISGHVTDSTANPLPGVCVLASPSAPGGDTAGAHTDSNGFYTITDIAAGTYTLSFTACSAGNYAPDTITGVQATVGQPATENATLAPGGTISGTVTDSSGKPLSGVCVSVGASAPDGQGSSADTDATGAYTISSLTPGSYTVNFSGCSAGNYVSTRITGVQVMANATATQNASLAPAGTISGNVTDISGKPIAGACVSANPSVPGGQGGGANVAADGSYTIKGLAAGSYTLLFSACSAGDYQSASVPAVQVTAGQTTTENASLAPGGAISGTVTDSSGQLLSGACVSANPSASGGQVGGATTDANGNYTISGLAPGTYSVTFSGCSAGNYAPATITGTQVTAGHTTLQNATLTPGGTISGQVTDSTGKPLADICADATTAALSDPSGGDETDSNGVYTIADLAPGTYTVDFSDCAADTYAHNTITGVQVTAGKTTTQNATLVLGGAIKGKLTDGSGRALSGACVTVRAGGRTGTIHTDSNGAFSIGDVPPGSYTFTFSGCSAGNYLSQTFTVQISSGQTTTLNATLVQPGTITGKILNTDKNSVVGACVTASPSGSATTNASGVYTITGLTPGSYTLTIKGCSAGTYFTQTIASVQVTAGQTTTQNITLVAPGTITGKIVDTAGNAVARGCVTASPSGSAKTNASGVYTITGLTAGTYTLTIKGCNLGTYFTKTITGVQVGAGKTATENVTLVQPGTITGKILNQAKNAVAGACVTAGPAGSATTNSSGVYTIAGLTPGSYTLTIKGCSAGTYFTTTIPAVQVAAGQTTTVAATLVAPGTITGKISNSSGKALSGACVSASPSGGNTTTNASGVYTLTGLVAGTYTLTIKGCTAGTYVTKTITNVQIAAGKTATENASLVPG